MESKYISFGIDLGTTNSCIARSENDKITVFANNENMLVTPSVVRIERNGTVRVGRKAYESILESPESVASEFKRWMGQKDLKSFKGSKRTWSAEELSGEVLKSLLNDARRRTGEPVESAVVTVPAAFGQLQCAATKRAAELAGLKECPLLQEPIAVAMSYGISPEMKNQKWIVFDLGGGTFDVAIVSSRDGKLKVLNHRGDNQLGGKDLDRMIVEKKLLPALRKNFTLPDPAKNPAAFAGLLQRLHLKAEQAKIDLSIDQDVLVEFFDLGDDLEEIPYDGEVTITREELDQLSKPLIKRAIEITRQAMREVSLKSADINKILLAGGPTQMPLLRQLLVNELGVEIDLSVDPMTAIARGAAVWAATLESKASSVAVSKKSGSNERVKLGLAYNSVSSTPESKLWYKIEAGQKNQADSIRISSRSGHWDSGWIPVSAEAAPVLLKLLNGKTCEFDISCRDKKGRIIECEPSSFSIRHGLVLERPPLPHSISCEVALSSGSKLDMIFNRGVLLPCSTERIYKANRSLSPEQANERISIKIWEGEVLEDPQANDFVGCLQIASEEIDRSIPEGTEIELSISIDESRLMHVSAYIPLLQQEFSDAVFIAERDEESMIGKLDGLASDLDEMDHQLDSLEEQAAEFSQSKRISEVRNSLKKLRLQVNGEFDSAKLDPDKAKKLVSQARALKADLSKVNSQLGKKDEFAEQESDFNIWTDSINECLNSEANESASSELSNLLAQGKSAISRKNLPDLRRVNIALSGLHYRLIYNKFWYWSSRLTRLIELRHEFQNQNLASHFIDNGLAAQRANNLPKLREAVEKLWELPRTTNTGRENLDTSVRLLADIKC